MTPKVPRRQSRTAPVITQAEAARIVGIARQNVLGAVARGDLVAAPGTDPVMITRKSAERWAAERHAAEQSAA
ncbi:MAG TPA: hypothetical protein DGD08_08420 [Gemmatimonas aurantiaca]|nr:hypothetical protein [Gemmatimonas aurantiaca]